MKTLRIWGMALLAVLMCVNFASCSNEEVVPDEPAQDKYITVGLDCVGEFLDIKDSPLSRTVRYDTYYIQVYSDGMPYANGFFGGSLDGVTVKLLQGAKYSFSVAVIVDEGTSMGGNFSYDSTYDIFSDMNTGGDPFGQMIATYEVFYGELGNYTPKEAENVEIATKRVSYGADYIAENLHEGTLGIGVYIDPSNIMWGSRYCVDLTPEKPESNGIYSFYSYRSAWIGTNFSCSKTLVISWTKENGEVIPFGTYDVTFKRNVRTTIRINVAEVPSVNNGITVTREDTPITDDENEYEISGGEIIEVPVNSEP